MSEINVSKINASEINASEINASKINASEINASEIQDMCTHGRVWGPDRSTKTVYSIGESVGDL